MSAERKSILERGAEVSKKIDKTLIAVGSGIYVLFSAAVGAAIIIGSAITIVPAEMIQRWAEKRRR